MSAPEPLSIWDRLFNRTRTEIHARGEEKWINTPMSYGLPMHSLAWEYTRHWIEYKITDRITGSETIKKVYLP